MKFLKDMINNKKPEDDGVLNVKNVSAMIDDFESEDSPQADAFNNLAAIQSKIKSTQSSPDGADAETGTPANPADQVSDFADVVDQFRDKDAPPHDASAAQGKEQQSSDLTHIMTEEDFDQLDDELARMSDELEEQEAKAQSEPSLPSAPQPSATPMVKPEALAEVTQKPTPVAAQPNHNPEKGTDADAGQDTAPAIKAANVFGGSKGPHAEKPRDNGKIQISERQGGGSAEPVKAVAPAVPKPVKEPEMAPVENVAQSTPQVVEIPAPAAGRSGRRAGRVKTRLLGFEHSDGGTTDPFDVEKATTPSNQVNFPVGWIVVVDGPGVGTAFALFNGVSKIGRGDDQVIKLDFGDSSISRDNHAAVAYDLEQHAFFLGHGGKANLVRLNNKPVLSTEEIVNNDHIRIGETTLRFVALCGEDFNWDGKAGESQTNVVTA